MIVVFSRAAEDDLEKIGDYVARDNPERAITFVGDLIAGCQSLTEAPLAFPLVPGYERHGIRRRAADNYLIFYRVAASRIEIVHVLHGARDYESILFPANVNSSEEPDSP